MTPFDPEDTSSTSATNQSTATCGAASTTGAAPTNGAAVQAYSEHTTTMPSVDTSSTNRTTSSEDATSDTIVDTGATKKISMGIIIYVYLCAQSHHNSFCAISDSHILEDQLFNDNLLRLWRTGAAEELYLSSEDGDIDVSTCN